MIKRIRFATRRHDVDRRDFERTWRAVTAGVAGAPPGVRPVRAAVCTALPDLAGGQARHDGAALGWFLDDDHLCRFEAWLAGPEPAALRAQDERVVAADESPVVVADEVVLRGAEWLDRRWAGGGPILKHMALAVRAGHLAPAEFSERWRDHAGQARRAGAAQQTVIPGDVRGRAYVQDHPCPRAAGEWAYDAVSEVYFDDLDGLRRRIDWFRDNGVGRAPDGLFGATWLLAVREDVIEVGA